jgi:hypothetical protein
MRPSKPFPEAIPAVMERGRQKRGAAEAASQRSDAALSWDTLKGGVVGLLKRLGTG